MKTVNKLYIFFFILVISFWSWYMFSFDAFELFEQHWMISLTMVVGSFIAGASSEGGGAIAYPVFTLLLDIPPAVARNFSFAIQSIGMTAASLTIIGLRIKIELKAILYASIGGLFGLILGSFFLLELFSNTITKLFFVSLWLSFGFALFLTNKIKNRIVQQKLSLSTRGDISKLLLFGFVGGIITSLFGNGIDIFTFCLLTLFYGLSEKIATPTSVVIMTINTIGGFFIHLFALKDFQHMAFEYWMVSIPIVIVFAPVGAVFISKVSRHTITYLLYAILLAQYIGAIIIIRPSFWQLLMSMGVIFFGFLFFWRFSRKARMRQMQILTG
ncbi:sulfite exporter TauE/SafE family protein [Flavobacteriaceae bacterium M23B6Z8]